MVKNRDKQKANKRKEQELNRKTEWGTKDLTPYNAVKSMNGKEITYK